MKRQINTMAKSMDHKTNLDLLITVHDDVEGLKLTLRNLETALEYFNLNVILKCTSLGSLNKFKIASFPRLVVHLVEKPDGGIYSGMNDTLEFFDTFRRERGFKPGFWAFINTGDLIDFSILNSLLHRACNPSILCGSIRYIRTDGSYGRMLHPNFCNKNWARILGAKPGHMSFFLNNEVAVKYYDTNYKIAADYKWMLEYLGEIDKKNGKIYISKDITSFMKLGGTSTGSWKKFMAGQRESFEVRQEIYGWYSAFLGLIKPIWSFL